MCNGGPELPVGKFCKIVWNDGDETKVKRGTLVSVGDDFLELRTRENTYIVRRGAIISIKALGGRE